MSWKFNPPPGWPQQPEGWAPPPGWTPDPSWPAAPPGWQFWVPAGAGPASGPPAASSPAAAAPPAAAPPAGSPPAGSPPAGGPAAGQMPAAGTGAPAFPQTGQPPAAGARQQPFPQAGQPPAAGQPQFAGAGQPQFASAGQASFPAGSAVGPATPPPYQPAPAGGRPWFGRWWTIVALVGLLLLGTVAGFGGTRVALELTAAESGPSDEREATAAPTPEPTESIDSLFPPPTEPPFEPPSDGEDVGALCGQVAVIMLPVWVAGMEEIDDIDVYLDGVVDARRTAADELRDLETGDSQERSSLDTFASEVDDAADNVDDNRRDIDAIEGSFEQVGDAYTDFNTEHC